MTGPGRSGTTTRWPRPLRRLVAAGLLPERAGQPVKAWVHISLADLLLLDADSALQDQWTAQIRERWAARRAFASETGSEGGAWLDGDAAGAITCDAAMAPLVTGDVDPAVLEDLVRLCVQLGKLRYPGGPGGGTGGSGDTGSDTGTGTGTDSDTAPGSDPGTDRQDAPAQDTSRAW
ncbi:MAG: hypothetical protein ACRDPF_06800, partial [Streptosporangiaceae bacterium]